MDVRDWVGRPRWGRRCLGGVLVHVPLFFLIGRTKKYPAARPRKEKTPTKPEAAKTGKCKNFYLGDYSGPALKGPPYTSVFSVFSISVVNRTSELRPGRFCHFLHIRGNFDQKTIGMEIAEGGVPKSLGWPHSRYRGIGHRGIARSSSGFFSALFLVSCFARCVCPEALSPLRGALN